MKLQLFYKVSAGTKKVSKEALQLDSDNKALLAPYKNDYYHQTRVNRLTSRGHFTVSKIIVTALKITKTLSKIANNDP